MITILMTTRIGMIDLTAFGTGFGMVLLGLVLGVAINIVLSVVREGGKI